MAGTIDVVFNVGSSTLKVAAFGSDGRLIAKAVHERDPAAGAAGDDALVTRAFGDLTPLGQPRAIGHRVVHGGRAFDRPVRIDADVIAALDRLSALAPLHQPPALAVIRAVGRLAPELPQIACFDTAFHRTQPDLLRRFALPERYFEAGIERYGFHGLSYAGLARSLSRRPQGVPKRLLAFHLGAGSSACALLDGASVATSMGFTALDGLMMATRPGALDPGVVLHLIESEGMAPAEVGQLLYKGAGLLGVSGLSGDMRALRASDAPAAARAIEMFVLRAAMTGAGLAVAIGGLDAVAFTGGIGENDQGVRDAVMARLGPFGAVETIVVPADEEGEIARALAELG